MSIFEQLNKINVNGHTEKKNGLTYLSWAWAWAEVKKLYPEAFYTIYERETEYGPVNYFTDGRTCWVKTGVTVNGIEHIEYLPVMDHRNRSIAADAVTSFDVNKAIQRSLTKAVARHGLGLYIYAGEDLPEGEEKEEDPPADAWHYQPLTYDAALLTVAAVGKYPDKALKDIYKEDKAYIKELFEIAPANVQQAINIIQREIKKKNESKSDSKDQ